MTTANCPSDDGEHTEPMSIYHYEITGAGLPSVQLLTCARSEAEALGQVLLSDAVRPEARLGDVALVNRYDESIVVEVGEVVATLG